MGLAVNPASMHYEQSDGYVHAVDLRTVGRGWWRNWGVEGYFRAMGFGTLRHRGTEDHLHVMDPHPKKHAENVELVKKEVEHRGLSVIVPTRACIHLRRKQRQLETAAATA